MKNLYIFFDTETTGLPKDWKAPMNQLNNWPRVIQLAWATYDDTGKEIGSKCDLITPDGWTIPNEKFWIDNGYSTEVNQEKGIPIALAVNHFTEMLAGCHTLVSHNMSYDYNVLGAEMLRMNIHWSKELKLICTKEESTDFVKLPGSYGKYKWPKLSELHQHLFGTGFENAHDALADVRACAKCFFDLAKKGVIKLN